MHSTWNTKMRHCKATYIDKISRLFHQMVAVPDPPPPPPLSLLSNTMEDNEMGTGTAKVTFIGHISRWRRPYKFKSEKSPSENLDLWTYKTKDSFFCYASDISCVQRAFWAQLVETVEVPFKTRAPSPRDVPTATSYLELCERLTSDSRNVIFMWEPKRTRSSKEDCI